jgi:hypothetical protein
VIPGEEPPTDETGELLLPVDLQALADQLFDDAAHLAAQYPAESSENWLADSAAPADRLVERNSFRSRATSKTSSKAHWAAIGRRLAIVGSGIVSLSLLAAAVAVYWMRTPGEAPRQTAGRAVDAALAQPGEAAVSSNLDAGNKAVAESDDRAAEFSAFEDELSPVLFLQNVSAPQLEGVYDLIEESGEDAGDVSI